MALNTVQIIKRCLGIVQKVDSPIDKKVTGNTTSINTTSNNIYIKEKFVAEVMTFDYPKEMLEDFINYWTEGKKKMRFQKQATFEIKLRLLRWAKNQKQWNKPQAHQSKIHAQLNAYLEAKKLI